VEESILHSYDYSKQVMMQLFLLNFHVLDCMTGGKSLAFLQFLVEGDVALAGSE
jgi:hypothetical protein